MWLFAKTRAKSGRNVKNYHSWRLRGTGARRSRMEAFLPAELALLFSPISPPGQISASESCGMSLGHKTPTLNLMDNFANTLDSFSPDFGSALEKDSQIACTASEESATFRSIVKAESIDTLFVDEDLHAYIGALAASSATLDPSPTLSSATLFSDLAGESIAQFLGSGSDWMSLCTNWLPSCAVAESSDFGATLPVNPDFSSFLLEPQPFLSTAPSALKEPTINFPTHVALPAPRVRTVSASTAVASPSPPPSSPDDLFDFDQQTPDTPASKPQVYQFHSPIAAAPAPAAKQPKSYTILPPSLPVKKPKAERKLLPVKATRYLERYFNKIDQKPGKGEKERLAEKVGCDERKIAVWFQSVCANQFVSYGIADICLLLGHRSESKRAANFCPIR